MQWQYNCYSLYNPPLQTTMFDCCVLSLYHLITEMLARACCTRDTTPGDWACPSCCSWECNDGALGVRSALQSRRTTIWKSCGRERSQYCQSVLTCPVNVVKVQYSATEGTAHGRGEVDFLATKNDLRWELARSSRAWTNLANMPKCTRASATLEQSNRGPCGAYLRAMSS